jgi:hypothetical protein
MKKGRAITAMLSISQRTFYICRNDYLKCKQGRVIPAIFNIVFKVSALPLSLAFLNV